MRHGDRPDGVLVHRQFGIERGGELARRVQQVAAAVALVCANSQWSEGYLQLWRTPLGLRIGDFTFERSLEWFVNDALMVIFFFVVGLEIKREMLVGELAGKPREQLKRALFWQGFGMLGSDCFVHPSVDLTNAFDALIADGLGELLGRLKPLIAADTPYGSAASDLDMVHAAWNLNDLAAMYASFVQRYQPVLAQLRADVQVDIDGESAFLLRTLLIHDYRRLLLRDPELPEVLLPTKWPGQTARMLTKELYRRLLAPSESHLNKHLILANGDAPPASDLVLRRFECDPLSSNAL